MLNDIKSRRWCTPDENGITTFIRSLRLGLRTSRGFSDWDWDSSLDQSCLSSGACEMQGNGMSLGKLCKKQNRRNTNKVPFTLHQVYIQADFISAAEPNAKRS